MHGLIDKMLVTLDKNVLDMLLTHNNNGTFGFVRYTKERLLGVNVPDDGRYEIISVENNWAIFTEKTNA